MKKAAQRFASIILMATALFAADQPVRKIVHHEDPEYPTLAAQMSLHGTVKIKVWIAVDGTVHRLEYIGGHPLLAESALKAVRNWKYESAQKESTETVEVKF